MNDKKDRSIYNYYRTQMRRVIINIEDANASCNLEGNRIRSKVIIMRNTSTDDDVSDVDIGNTYTALLCHSISKSILLDLH